ncbi:methyltransferase domain-containing protein [Roseovarius spongiae]|uniref:Methyltransferase domain-containing protein n=1 Tax=Roseovarius spongiae TaxID=2320272 RepID=A0A3A8AT34_9RHOB|nr:methyltransferase domain-containing protein [Roseovarius spongiae]RKF14674.1 methyltransferase domain-containing protein [Roseovarius spongiae]
MSADDETLAVYGAKADDYAALFEADAETNRHLARFMAALPAGGRALDLGCGPGGAAAALADAGFRVDAIDAVAEMVAMAARHPGVTAWRARFDDIAGDALYDGIWANFSLLHAARADLPRHLAALRTALKPGGVFHIGMKTGRSERRDSLGRLYTYYTEAELRALLRDAGFVPGPGVTGRGKGLSGSDDPWVVILADG